LFEFFCLKNSLFIFLSASGEAPLHLKYSKKKEELQYAGVHAARVDLQK
jgi:hypothetical protein